METIHESKATGQQKTICEYFLDNYLKLMHFQVRNIRFFFIFQEEKNLAI